MSGMRVYSNFQFESTRTYTRTPVKVQGRPAPLPGAGYIISIKGRTP
jgi:hypothetical protein